MTPRDLYAACVGLFLGLAAQCLVQYLVRPSTGLALCVIVLMVCFVIAVACHVAVIVKPAMVPAETGSKSAKESVPVNASAVVATATTSEQ